MRYNLTIEHVPGKDLVVASALWRPKSEDSLCIAKEVAAYEHALIRHLGAPDVCLEQLVAGQDSNLAMSALKKYVPYGWAKCKLQAPQDCLQYWQFKDELYWQFKDELTLHNGIIMKSCQYSIPLSMRPSLPEVLPDGHEGVIECSRRAKDSCWWPGITRGISDIVKGCKSCL